MSLSLLSHGRGRTLRRVGKNHKSGHRQGSACIEALENRMLLAANLVIQPTTWNVVGIDSNKPATAGPDTYLAGVRVINTGDAAATNVQSRFVWDTSNAYINIKAGDTDTLSIASLAPGTYQDFYYDIQVSRTSAAYDAARRFHVTASADGGLVASTPNTVGAPGTSVAQVREIYVEHYVSQNRNSVLSFADTTPGLPAGHAYVVGGTYEFTLTAKTSSAYGQLFVYPTFSNSNLRLISSAVVQSPSSSGAIYDTYSLPAPGVTNDRFYADAGGWINNPADANYFTKKNSDPLAGPDLYVGGKVGGDITMKFRVQLVGSGTTVFYPTILDYSGSSFHYNADFGTNAIVIQPKPLAANDAYTTDINTTLTVAAPGVMVNDSDPAGSAITAIKLTNPSHGTITSFNADGSFTYVPNTDFVGTDTFTYRVQNAAGVFSDPATVTITISNTTPSGLVLNSDTIKENDLFFLQGSFTDPDPGQTHTVTIHWSDGSADTTLNLAAGVFAFEADHRYLDDNPTSTSSDVYAAGVTVTDSASASVSGTANVTVNNVAPVLSLGNALTVDEGDGFIRVGSFTDPGTQDTWVATVNYGDGAGAQALTLNANKTFSLSHFYTDNGTYTITVSVSDDDGGTQASTLQVNVNNVAPLLRPISSQSIKVGTALNLIDLGVFTDSGSDLFTYSIDWGDKTALDEGAATVDVAGNPTLGVLTSGSFDGSHTYAKKGTYTVSVTILDDDGGSSTSSFLVYVKSA